LCGGRFAPATQLLKKLLEENPVQSINRYEPEVLRQSVFVFSQNYLPVSRINIKRAIALLVTGRAEPLELMSQQTWQVISPRLVLQVPEHIRLTLTKSERFWRVPSVARREVLRRDNHTCQYCGSTKKLTIDHVIPRAKGGLNTWENVVIACETCNQRKGNRTPLEANMTLRTKPKAPMHPTVAFAEQFWRSQQENNSG
jgi:5-methylcytosine-specific restriction endonuclease McrA